MEHTYILDYIEKKKNFVKNDRKLFFILEVLFIKENCEIYKKNFIDLERRMVEEVTAATPSMMNKFLAKASKNSHRRYFSNGKQVLFD